MLGWNEMSDEEKKKEIQRRQGTIKTVAGSCEYLSELNSEMTRSDSGRK